MDYLINGFFAFFIAIVFTPILIEVLKRFNIVDNPDNNRKIHKEPIPRLGGIVIFLIFVWFILLKDIEYQNFKCFLLGSIIIFGTGLFDDLFGLKWFYKFILQIISSILFIIFLEQFGTIKYFFLSLELTHSFGILLLLIFMLGALNTFNLLDGLDGLVSGISLIFLIMCIYLLQNYEADLYKYLLSIIIGSLLGFLMFNSNPARIFLGDSGSLLLGYIVTGLIIITYLNINNNGLDFAFLGYIYSVNIIDTLRVIVKRIKTNKNPFLPDKNHLHHIIFKNFSHEISVILMLLFSLISIIVGLLYIFISKTISTILFILTFIFLYNIPLITFKIKRSFDKIILRIKNKFYFLSLFENLLIYFLPSIILVLILMLILQNFNNHNHFKLKTLMSFQIYNIFIFTYAFINVFRKNYIPEILLFFNIFLFFVISNKKTVENYISVSNNYSVEEILFNLFIIIYISFSLISLSSNNLKKVSLFTGNDLIILLLILTVNLFNNLIPEDFSAVIIKDIFLKSFLIYIFYKIFTFYNNKIKIVFYLSSFLLVNLYILKITFNV